MNVRRKVLWKVDHHYINILEYLAKSIIFKICLHDAWGMGYQYYGPLGLFLMHKTERLH